MNPEIVAYHEAAHAVVAWCFGDEVRWIELWNEEFPNRQGHTRRRTDLRFIKKACSAIVGECQCKRIERGVDMVVTWAGPLAGMRLGDPNTDKLTDMKEIECSALSLTSQDAQAALSCMHITKALAEEMIESNWSRIETLGSALLANGRIVKGDEIKALLGEPANPQGYTDDVVAVTAPEFIIADA